MLQNFILMRIFLIIILFFSYFQISCKKEIKKKSFFNTDIYGRLVPLMISNPDTIKNKYHYSIAIEIIDSITFDRTQKLEKSVDFDKENTIFIDSNESNGIKNFYTALKFIDSMNIIEGKKSMDLPKFRNGSFCERIDSSTFSVTVENGKKIYFRNEIQSDEFVKTTYSFNYFDSDINSYFILKEFGNGGAFTHIVNRRNRQNIEIWGEGFPVISKRLKRIAALSNTGPCSDNPNGFQLFSFDDSLKIKKEVEVNIEDTLEPVNLIWEDTNSVLVQLTGDYSETPKYVYYRIKFRKHRDF